MYVDLYGIVMAALMQLPAAVIGFVCGMLFMRQNYLRILKTKDRQIARQQRMMGSHGYAGGAGRWNP